MPPKSEVDIAIARLEQKRDSDQEKLLLQFQNISDKIEAWQESISIQMADLRSDLAKIDKTITGNGNPESGLALRVDRLEVKSRTQSKVTWLIITGVIGAVITSIQSWLRL